MKTYVDYPWLENTWPPTDTHASLHGTNDTAWQRRRRRQRWHRAGPTHRRGKAALLRVKLCPRDMGMPALWPPLAGSHSLSLVGLGQLHSSKYTILNLPVHFRHPAVLSVSHVNSWSVLSCITQDEINKAYVFISVFFVSVMREAYSPRRHSSMLRRMTGVECLLRSCDINIETFTRENLVTWQRSHREAAMRGTVCRPILRSQSQKYGTFLRRKYILFFVTLIEDNFLSPKNMSTLNSFASCVSLLMYRVYIEYIYMHFLIPQLNIIV